MTITTIIFFTVKINNGVRRWKISAPSTALSHINEPFLSLRFFYQNMRHLKTKLFNFHLSGHPGLPRGEWKRGARSRNFYGKNIYQSGVIFTPDLHSFQPGPQFIYNFHIGPGFSLYSPVAHHVICNDGTWLDDKILNCELLKVPCSIYEELLD